MQDLKKPTPEETAIYEKYEKEMSQFYEARLPFLRLMHEHETLKAEIAEARIRELQANHAFMQAKVAQEEAKKKHAAEKTENSEKKD